MATRWLLAARRFTALHGAFVPLFFVAAAAPDSCTPAPATCHLGLAGPDAGGTTVSCVNDPRVAACGTHVEALGEFSRVKLRIESQNPDPPANVSTNTWVVRVLDASGAPITPAEFKGYRTESNVADPYMPDHNHNLGPGPQIVANGNGTYTVSALSLRMAGMWRMAFEIRTADGQTDRVAFYMCVQG